MAQALWMQLLRSHGGHLSECVAGDGFGLDLRLWVDKETFEAPWPASGSRVVSLVAPEKFASELMGRLAIGPEACGIPSD